MDNAAGADAPAADVWAARSDPPFYAVDLWPHRSLSGTGKKRFLWLMTGGFALPLLPLVTTKVIWIPLLFALATLGAVAWALTRNTADGRLVEQVRLWPDEMRVERIEPSGRVLRWSADPYWVRLIIHEDGRPENYLTVKGGGREIELGAFLSPEERLELAAEIENAIRRSARAG
ncbi:MAG: DUF2244 domain-containing protein [Pseudomonadota bacterium]